MNPENPVSWPTSMDSEETLARRLTAYMRNRPPLVSLLIPLFLALSMAWLDRETTWEVSLFVFYGLPIVLTVWWIGPLAGYGLALTCGLLWWVSNYESNPYETAFGYLWASVSRVIFFAVVVYAVTAVRNRQEADTARILALEQRRQLEKDLVAVSEHEQQRIGQDLHDGLCQQLAAIGLAARSLADELHAQGSDSVRDAELIESSIREAVGEARGMARGIFPVQVDRHGLAVALCELARTTQRLTGVRIEVEELGESRVPSPEDAMHLYRIAQEAVANAVRHGGASIVKVVIEGTPELIVISIADDGNGFPAHPEKAGGMGLRTMRYRAEVIGARLFIPPPDNSGATIRCEMPLHRPAHPA